MGEVREGLICPICMHDLGTVEELTSHFKLAHPEPEANEALASLKDIFAKAKKKLLNEDNRVPGVGAGARDRTDRDQLSTVPQNVCYTNLDISEQTEPGYIVSHTEMFRTKRANRALLYGERMDKLIIRMGKLLAPGTPIGNDKKRREFEQSKVTWVDEQLVSRCPTCAEPFSTFMGRRKHHCRLCGAVTCQDCSQFVDNALAQKLLQGLIGPGIPVLELRCCTDCFELLLRKKLILSQENVKDPLQEAYVKMRELIDRAFVLKTQYITVTDALLTGGSSLAEAQDLFRCVLKLVEKADAIAKKIGESSKDPNLPPRQAQLRLLIRAGTLQYLKELHVSMPPLPEAEELDRLAQQRREEALRRAERVGGAPVISAVVVAGGWSPQMTSDPGPSPDGSEGTNPFLEQIEIVKRFIQKAKAEGRTDEIHILTENLRDLEMAAGLRS